MSLRSLFWLVLLPLLTLLLFGCAGTKAVDSTRAVQALTAGESHVTYSLVPGLEGLDPSLQGKVVAIPTVPGKDVDFKAYYPDGQMKLSLTTARSPVIDVLLAGVAGIDAEKFAEDARMRAWVTAEREAWMALIGPMIQAKFAASLASSTAAAAQPTGQWQDQMKELIAQAVADALARKTP